MRIFHILFWPTPSPSPVFRTQTGLKVKAVQQQEESRERAHAAVGARRLVEEEARLRAVGERAAAEVCINNAGREKTETKPLSSSNPSLFFV